MRIGVNATFHGDRYSGVASSLIGLVSCLVDLGHEVIVYGSSASLQITPGVQLKAVSSLLRSDNGWLASLCRIAWNQAVLPFHIRRDRLTVILSSNMDGILWSPVRQILVIHDVIPLLYPEEAPRHFRYYKFLLPRVLARVDNVLTVSQSSKNDLVRCYRLDPEKVRVVYNGVSGELANPASDQKPDALRCGAFFLFVGTFAPRKNLATVLHALAQSKAEVPESLVVVASPDRWMRSAQKTIAQLGLADRVLLLSELPPRELAYLYRHATALFLLSEYEGFGLPAIEAMRAGTPAVVSESAALAEVVGDAAIKVEAHDVRAAAAAMCQLSRQWDFREKWRQRGLERARIFDWKRTCRPLRELLEQFS